MQHRQAEASVLLRPLLGRALANRPPPQRLRHRRDRHPPHRAIAGLALFIAGCTCGGAGPGVVDSGPIFPDATPPVDVALPYDAVPVDAEPSDAEPDPCAPERLPAHSGCAHSPTITMNRNYPTSGVFVAPPYGLAIVNPGARPAHVEIDGRATAVEVEVAPESVHVEQLPWIGELCISPSLVAGGAYRVTSDRPVAVVQYSPVDLFGAMHGAGDATATAVPPHHRLGSKYLVLGIASAVSTGYGTVTVTAIEDDTTVTMTPSVELQLGFVDHPAGVPMMFGLDAGDVAQFRESSRDDVTGTIIEADRPIQVTVGGQGMSIAAGVSMGDDLAEVVPPLDAWGTEYFVVGPATGAFPAGVPHVVRIMAAGPDVTTIGLEGSHDPKTVDGAPAMVFPRPTSEFRGRYRFFAPDDCLLVFVDIFAPSSAPISLDGFPTPPLAPVGATGWWHVRASLSGGFGIPGAHVIQADEPVGVSVHGIDSSLGFWFAP